MPESSFYRRNKRRSAAPVRGSELMMPSSKISLTFICCDLSGQRCAISVALTDKSALISPSGESRVSTLLLNQPLPRGHLGHQLPVSNVPLPLALRNTNSSYPGCSEKVGSRVSHGRPTRHCRLHYDGAISSRCISLVSVVR